MIDAMTDALTDSTAQVHTYLPSPLGELLAARDEHGLTALYLPTGKHASIVQAPGERDNSAFDDVRLQLAEYFAGARREFVLPLNARGSAFQLRVWTALRQIPYGETASYGHTAAAIGAPTAARAVGLANGQNPISIIVPCHRVIGANGALTGYGGGIEAKRWLLAHEASHAGLFSP